MDLVLLQPPIADYYLTAGRTLPYGLAVIAAAVRAAGYTASILDALATRRSRAVTRPQAFAHLDAYFGRPDGSSMALFHTFRRFGYSDQHLAGRLAAAAPKIVGISSLFTAYADSALAMAALVKRVAPGTTVVMGGHHPTALPESVMAHASVDFVIRGDGEAALPALLDALLGSARLESVPGLVRRDPDGGLHMAPVAVAADLNKAPLPDMTALGSPAYRRYNRPAMVITTSRGCPMNCSYCCQGRDSPIPFRQRTLASILAEIDHGVTAHGVRFIDFEDEHLTLDQDRFLKLMAAVTRRYGHLPLELRAMNGLFPPSVTEAVVAAMARAGFREINLSLGTTATAQLRRFRRPDVTAAFDRAVDIAHRHGLRSVGYIIVGAPDQGADESLSDLIHLATLPVLAGVSVFYPAPGSADYDRCAQLGLLPGDFRCMRASALPVEHTTSRLAIVTLLRLARLANFVKGLVDRGGVLPIPAPVPDHLDVRDRIRATSDLVGGFFHDGRLRGVMPDGTVYVHQADPSLCDRFRQQATLQAIRGMGP